MSSNLHVSKGSNALQDINLHDLYVYNLSKEVLNSLKLLYFDSDAQLAPVPNNVKLPALERPTKKSDAVLSNDSLLDLDSVANSLPQIIQPKAPKNEDQVTKGGEDSELVHHEDNHDDSGSEIGLDDIDEEESESETENSANDSLYQRVQETYTASPAANDEGPLVSYLNTRSAYLFFESALVQSDLLKTSDEKNQDNQKAFAIFKSVFGPKEIQNPIHCLQNWREDYQHQLLQKAKIAENLAKRNITNNVQVQQHQQKVEEYSALFMIGGGHFAAAIVSHTPKNIKKYIKQSEADILPQSVNFIDHRSFHRYTTRRKQGGSQSAMDNAKGKANSAGSSLRRYNEQALAIDVKNVIQEWKGYLTNCKSIFIRANTQANFKNIVSGDNINNTKNNKEFKLYKNDPRIKSFPFSTKRATVTELKTAWINLTYLTVASLPKVDTKAKLLKQRQQQQVAAAKLKQQEKRSASPAAKTSSEQLTPEVTQTNELIQLLKKSKAPALISYIRKNKLDVNTFRFAPAEKYEHNTPTLLHYAADNKLHHMVYILVNNLKMDPTVTNKRNKTPWDILTNNQDDNNNDDHTKQTKYAFRKARHNLGESFCNWSKSHIAEPLSDEQIRNLEEQESKEQKEAIEKILNEEKQRSAEENAKKLQSVRGKGSGFVLDQSGHASIDRQVLSSLSEEDRRRVEREKRARAIEARLGINKK